MSETPKKLSKSKFLLEMEASTSAAVLAASPDRAEMYNMFGDFLEEMRALKARVTEIERGGVKYVGVHQRAMSYRRGSMVTHDGNVFAAVRDVAEGETPMKSDGWQLAVKAGRDAR